MIDGLVRQIADAVLYEGYLLYPYRPDALKNLYRWTFGTLYPRAFSEAQDGTDPWWMRAECLVQASSAATVEVTARFLRLVDTARPGDVREDAVEGEVTATHPLGLLAECPQEVPIAVGDPVALGGVLALTAVRLDEELFRVAARVENLTPLSASASGDGTRSAALRRAFLSTQVLFAVSDGAFVSLLDPPASLREAAAGCRNVGAWPVLVGDPGTRDAMLAAPIILYDHPRVAPESPGDLFDGTEIDELLTLRLLTLTEGERRVVGAVDDRVRRLLERTEQLTPEARLRLHGTVRDRRPLAGTLRPGARVRLRPRAGGDVFDVALAGRTATVVALEQDYEGRGFVVVTVDDDPGSDLGLAGAIGHRFFFGPDEVEPLL